MLSALILLTTAACAGLMAWPKLANNRLWRATLTPLASIIGSGFLVLGPILDDRFGAYGLLAMAALCGMAALFGSAIRYNIAAYEKDGWIAGSPVERLEKISSWVLAFAYIISVAYYLNLFGAFGVSLADVDQNFSAKLLTTAMFAFILVIGWTRGFSALERLEQISVGLKLAVIGGLLVGLVSYFGTKAAAGDLVINTPQVTGWNAVAMLFGLIVTVQGFETSRYLGDTYSAKTRIASMRLAQIISTVIYLVYIGLVTFVFAREELHFSETAVVDMMGMVAPILTVLLVVAALSAQFSAAVADTSGSGGLFEELTHGRVSSRVGYLLLIVIGIGLTWTADVFQIIAYASRAFAAYYAIQAGIAAHFAHRNKPFGPLCISYSALMVLGLAIASYGTPVEGGD
jgi:hypothetical protein